MTRYWFKPKRYGYGATPVTWEGWAFTGLPMVFYFAGLAVAGAICLAHYRWIRGRTREGCFKAFLGNNWVGAAIFAGIVLDRRPLETLQRWLP